MTHQEKKVQVPTIQLVYHNTHLFKRNGTKFQIPNRKIGLLSFSTKQYTTAAILTYHNQDTVTPMPLDFKI